MRSDRKFCGRGLTCEDLGHGSALPRCHAIKTKPDATNDLPSQTRAAARVGAVARDATRGGQIDYPQSENEAAAASAAERDGVPSRA